MSAGVLLRALGRQTQIIGTGVGSPDGWLCTSRSSTPAYGWLVNSRDTHDDDETLPM